MHFLIHIVLMAKMCVITLVFTIYLLRAFTCSCVGNLFVFILLSMKWAIAGATIYWWRLWCCRFSFDDYIDDLGIPLWTHIGRYVNRALFLFFSYSLSVLFYCTHKTKTIFSFSLVIFYQMSYFSVQCLLINFDQ